MATLSMPGWGYGLRYNYGIFKQLLSNNGEQLEAPDPWLDRENVGQLPMVQLTAALGDPTIGCRLSNPLLWPS